MQTVLQHYTACKAPGASGPGHRGEWLRCRRCLSGPPIAQGGRQSVGGLQPNGAPQLIRGCRRATSELVFASPRPTATLSGTRTAASVERDAQRCSVSTQLLQPYTCASTLALAGVTVCRRLAALGRSRHCHRRAVRMDHVVDTPESSGWDAWKSAATLGTLASAILPRDKPDEAFRRRSTRHRRAFASRWRERTVELP